MTSPLAVRRDLKGVQRPRLSYVPPYVSSTGQEAIELAAMAGLHLDPWEQFVLSESLGEREDGTWAAFEVGLVVPRQNGKGSCLEARELAGLFLLEERLIVHSAHEFDTAMEHFRRLEELIEGTPEFSRRVKKVSHSHGREGIELMNGQRIRFRTRTKGGLRGFTGDLIVFDEAMIFPQAAHGAIMPTVAAKSMYGNPQLWYAGSAVDQWTMEHGLVLASIRERGLKGDDPALAYFEWSADADNPEAIADRVQDPETWAIANPGLGIRISVEHVAREQRSMDHRTFAVERLGVGDWPRLDGKGEAVIDLEDFEACIDTASKVPDPIPLAFDVTPDRSYAAIGIAGVRDDGLEHIEVVEHKRGTGWVAPRVAEICKRHEISEVACDGAGPAASLIPLIENLGIKVVTVTAKEHAQACGRIFDAFRERKLRHLGTPELAAAVDGAVKRQLGDAWAWSRKSSSVDISPLVACTLALGKVRANADLSRLLDFEIEVV